MTTSSIPPRPVDRRAAASRMPRAGQLAADSVDRPACLDVR